MVGFRKLETYIKKFGKEDGEQRYQIILSRRESRERRENNGRNIVLDKNNLQEEIKQGNAVECKACGYIGTCLKWSHFKHKCSIKTREEYIALFPNALLDAPNLIKMHAQTLEGMIKSYGDKIGNEKWQQYCAKQARSNSFEYKNEKYGWTPEEFKQYNKTRAITLQNLIKKHGETKGSEIWEQYCEKQKYTNEIEYFIEREGNESDGKNAWLEYNYAKGSSRRIPDIAKNLGISLDDACLVLSARWGNGKHVSDGERIFVNELEKQLKETIKYTYKTKQFCLWSHEAKQPFFYDVCCTKRNKIIEYNGDYWHANKNLYEKDFVVSQSGLIAEEIWKIDETKQHTAEKRGFDVYVVWESDFKTHGITKELIEWMNM